MSSVHDGLPGRPGEPGPGDLPDDPRLLQAVEDFLRELEAGRRPSRQEFLRRYPDLAGPLAQCLDGLDLVHKAAHSGSGPVAPLAAPREELPANPLGDFQIVRQIGRGGMGIVYEAVQLSLGRRVALKVLPFAATLDPKHLQRFHNEAHAAAQLHHTNIVPVYAVGCERGVHFYAMQLIEGQSLAAVIEQMRTQQPAGGSQSAGTETPGVWPALADTISAAISTQRASKPRDFFRAAARLLVQAASALEHAHQLGILHRDIKPANLLVDGHRRLWITDFGLAQFHADAGLTQTGDVVGTLRYMSPEQASGQRLLTDQRTDIYSLGATLYELVTLKPMFLGENRQQLLHQISHDEPRPPRALEPNIPVELETIIFKAVAKHPAERYASAQQFADDLERFLDHKPILARRPTWIERGRKWSRRHPSIVAASILLLAVCSAGLLISNWMIAREQAKTQAALSGEQQRAAEARRAVDLLVEVSEDELAEHPHLRNVRRRLLETALTYYQNFIDTHGSDAHAQAELEAGRTRVRNLLDELATLQGANLLALATDKGVQADLKLDQAQRDRLAALHERLSEQRAQHFSAQRLLAPEVRRQKHYELAKAQEAALADVLEPTQLGRLRQIELQLQGPRAFHDSAASALRLSAEQKRKVRQFSEETMAAIFSGPEKHAPGKQVNRERIHEIQKAELEQIIGILTPEQQAQWRDLTGEPFLGPRPVPPGRRPPFGTR